MTDHGLDDAIRAARTKRAEAERFNAEQETLVREAERRGEQARQHVIAAGKSFAPRAREAGIPLEKTRVHAGYESSGLFGRKSKPRYETLVVWTAQDSYNYEVSGGSMETYRVVPATYVLEDGAIVIGGVGYAGPERADAYLKQQFDIESEAKRIIEALATYLISHEESGKRCNTVSLDVPGAPHHWLAGSTETWMPT